MFAATVPNSNRAVHLSALTRFQVPGRSPDWLKMKNSASQRSRTATSSTESIATPSCENCLRFYANFIPTPLFLWELERDHRVSALHGRLNRAVNPLWGPHGSGDCKSPCTNRISIFAIANQCSSGQPLACRGSKPTGGISSMVVHA